MSTAVDAKQRTGGGLQRLTRVRLFEVAVVAPTLTAITVGLASGGFDHLKRPGEIFAFFFWIISIAVVDFFPVPAWRSLQVSIGFPLLMAVAFMEPAPVAGLIAFVGSSDPREFRREVRPLRALFNRSQISLSVFLASLVFHALGGDVLSWRAALPAAAVAVVVDYVSNSTLVSTAVSLTENVGLLRVMKKLRIGDPAEFFVSYLALGVLGVILARLYLEVDWWAAAAFLMPLLLARQMFFRTRALEDAARELQDREVVLRALSNRMAEERHDERSQIAGYLHDDLAQLLYRMSLHIDISRKHLAAGDPGNAIKELDSVEVAKDSTLKMVRSLIKDLHRNPIGRAGLSEAITSLCGDVHKDFGLRTETSLEDVEMAPPIQLLCYQVTREAIMNVVKHAEANLVRVTMEPTSEGARLTIQDDGKGFDPEQGSPEGHFGLTMMRERAQISGGSLEITSEPGVGSTVVADFKTTWLDQASGSQVLGPASRDREERSQ